MLGYHFTYFFPVLGISETDEFFVVFLIGIRLSLSLELQTSLPFQVFP